MNKTNSYSPNAGRKKLPTEEHILRGNPSKLPRKELDPSRNFHSKKLTRLPKAPSYLGEYGAREWVRTGKILVREGMLQESDLQVFEAYCMSVEVMIQSMQDISKHGYTVIGPRGRVRNPAISALGQASNSVRQFALEFGLSPSARSRIKLPSDDKPTLDEILGEAADEIEDFEDYIKGV